MPVVSKCVFLCARGFDNGSAAILIRLFETFNKDFCSISLEQSLLTRASVFKTLENWMKGYHNNLARPHRILSLLLLTPFLIYFTLQPAYISVLVIN